MSSSESARFIKAAIRALPIEDQAVYRKAFNTILIGGADGSPNNSLPEQHFFPSCCPTDLNQKIKEGIKPTKSS